MISLNKNLLLTKGSERACYIHPDDDTKLIKVIYHQKGTNDQNKLEYKYYNYLSKQKISYSHIAKCHGWTKTNLGEGLVFDRICNYDNTTSKQLTYFIQNKLLPIDVQDRLLEELKQYLDKNNVLFLDTATLNVLSQEFEKDKYKLVIIDGLGPKRDGFKFLFYRASKAYCRYKNNKQWKKFLVLVEKLRSL